MSQVNPIPKSNGIRDGEQITATGGGRGMVRDPILHLSLRKGLRPNTMEDAILISSVKRVFIIDSLIGTMEPL